MRVFISHSSDDMWIARQLGRQVGEAGADVFLDRDDVHVGDNFWERILAIAPQCDELLVLLTPWSVKRSYLWMEVGLFSGARKRINVIFYGMTLQQLKRHPNVSGAIDMLDVLELNSVDSYFDQLRQRVEKEVANGD